MIANHIAISRTKVKPPCNENSAITDCGKTSMIPDIMIKDVPFPSPFSVMRSPSHIAKTVPAVKITKPENQKTPGLKPGAIAFCEER